MAPVIDAHQHFWQRSQPFDYQWLDAPALASIRRDYLPEDLKPHLEATGVDRSIFVQTQHNLDENRWALGLADQYPFLAGVVGWVDLASHDCESQVEEFHDHPRFVGVRHVTQDEPDDQFIVRDEILRGLKVLERYQVPFDLLFYVKHLRHVPKLVSALPDLPMVLDHLAKPRVKDHSLDDWEADFRACGAFPNVYCKISGLITEADWQNWTVEDLKPYVQTALEVFGPERLMFGSDWPVCELAGSYEQVYSSAIEALGPLSSSESEAILGGTAARFYSLAP